MSSPAGVSMLKQMAEATMTEKVAVARTLTQTADERPLKSLDPSSVPLDVPGVLFAREGLFDVAADLRKQAAFLLSVAEGIDVILGVDPAVSEQSAKVAAVNSKLAEKEADRRAADREAAEAGDAKAAKREETAEAAAFAAHMQELRANAEAATYGPGTALPNQVEESVITEAATGVAQPIDNGWVCPTHGGFEVAVSKRGRQFRKCAEGCGQLEKL